VDGLLYLWCSACTYLYRYLFSCSVRCIQYTYTHIRITSHHRDGQASGSNHTRNCCDYSIPWEDDHTQVHICPGLATTVLCPSYTLMLKENGYGYSEVLLPPARRGRSRST
jgi:hypothetical protein